MLLSSLTGRFLSKIPVVPPYDTILSTFHLKQSDLLSKNTRASCLGFWRCTSIQQWRRQHYGPWLLSPGSSGAEQLRILAKILTIAGSLIDTNLRRTRNLV